MKHGSLRRRTLGAALAISLWTALVPARACEYYAEHFQIIHPSAKPAANTASSIAVFMEFTQIESADRLLGAATPVAERVELLHANEHRAMVGRNARVGVEPETAGEPQTAREPEPAGEPHAEAAAGIELRPGRDVSLSPTTGHLVLHGLTMPLHEGRQYPLTLMFEKAGAVDVDFIVGDH